MIRTPDKSVNNFVRKRTSITPAREHAVKKTAKAAIPSIKQPNQTTIEATHTFDYVGDNIKQLMKAPALNGVSKNVSNGVSNGG